MNEVRLKKGQENTKSTYTTIYQMKNVMNQFVG